MRSKANILTVGLLGMLVSTVAMAQGLVFPGTPVNERAGQAARSTRAIPANRAKAPAITTGAAIPVSVDAKTSSIPDAATQTTESVAAPAAAAKTAIPPAQDAKAEVEPATPGIASLLFRTFGALLLIVGLIAAVGWGLRRAGLVRRKSGGEGEVTLTVLTTLALGDKRSLQVVKFGDRTLLIGSTAQGINLLAEQGDASHEEYDEPVSEYTDLGEDEPAGYFEGEMARATLLNGGWNGRSN